MTKVYRTNASKRIGMEEIIKTQRKLMQGMLDFFDGDITLRTCYGHLLESEGCAEVYLEKLKHEESK